ncbi:hypothetical protein C7C56_013340 [Massilia glaciei]|uniref:Uncharacterized protein n=1 Tax=Massilia glaciei TaxID=1524097 RepID=A0A2U2HK42_9BURK|nr:hypothetical protein C7C56_013340 [Massilia glaciei]
MVRKIPLGAGDAQGMLAAFDALLGEYAHTSKGTCTVSLTVSDSVAAIVGLPWQDALSGPEELDAYADACFEQIGQTVNDGWTMNSYFRHYRAMGLAYALPTAWLDLLNEIIQTHGMRLDSVLPVTAAAFGRHRRAGNGKTSVLILRETNRTSALVYGASGLVDYTMEPTTKRGPESLSRLLRRLAGAHEIASVADWSADSADDTAWHELITACAPKAKYTRVKRDAWS